MNEMSLMMLYDIYGSMVLRLYGFMVNEFPFPSPPPQSFLFSLSLMACTCQKVSGLGWYSVLLLSQLLACLIDPGTGLFGGHHIVNILLLSGFHTRI